MGLLSKLLGGGWQRRIERARRCEQDGALGDALLEYERALAAGRGEVDPDEVREVERRAVALRDRIADAHLDEGDGYLAGDDVEAALHEYQTALQVAGSEGKEEQVQQRLDRLEAGLARELVEQAREPTEDETFQALSGGWDEEQYDEYETYGSAFREAFLAYHSGECGRAVDIYRELFERAGDDAVFLLFELGRAHAACAADLAEREADRQDVEAQHREAVGALERFLERLPDDWAPAVRAAGWNELAQIHLERGHADDAEDALMNAQEAVPAEPLAYLNLGRFLKREGRPADAVEALEQGMEVMDKLHPDFRIVSELGLAYLQAGREDEALATLESALEGIVMRQQGYHDPFITVPLAGLLEKKGRLREAADLYRHLADGPDAGSHASYDFHAARLLSALGDSGLARSYLARARELAGGDEELAGRIADLEREM